MLVTKRDGTEVRYDFSKIKAAVGQAFKNVHGATFGEDYKIVLNNIKDRTEKFENLHVEDIQKIAIEELKKIDEKVADEYETYKAKQALKRKERELKAINSKIAMIEAYKKAQNAATGSKYDANANVENKNIATLSGEIHKHDSIQLNRQLMYNKIIELYDEDTAKEYIRQLNDHEIYAHDETSIKPYCVSITMYPFLFNGLIGLGGSTTAPKNLDSFSGGFVNLVFAIESQFAGAVATVEFLMYMDYFVRREYGDDYYKNLDRVAITGLRERTIEERIEDKFAQIVYSINQPAAARDFQSVFWNISIFDRLYFESLFGGFAFPDGTAPEWESLDWIQRKFLKWFNKEREKALLTFPVVTTALLTDGERPADPAYGELVAEEFSEGQSMFIYMSESADSLASCCRLRNEVVDNTFSYSLGAGGVSTGSVNVITININRLVQDKKSIREQVKKVHKYQLAYRSIIKELLDAKLLPVYDSGFISLEKQFLTIGVNGFVEAAESQGIAAHPTKEYHKFVDDLLSPIFEENKKIKERAGIMFNTEFVPAENLGVKNANWDRNDGYIVPRDCYNSYFYAPDDEEINVIDKFKLHGRDFVSKLDGGSANHVNLAEHLTKEQYLNMLNTAAKLGTNYWTINVRNTVCNSCGHIDKHTRSACPKCGSIDLDYATRIIGYLKRVKANFSQARQKEESKRYYA